MSFNCDMPGCNEKFTRQDNLRRHRQNRHLEATLEQTSSLHRSEPLSRHDLDRLETADTKVMHQDLFIDSWIPFSESELARFQTLQLSDLESHEAGYMRPRNNRDFAGSSSRAPYWAPWRFPTVPASHRIINELVLKALQELEIRLELTQYQKTTGQTGGKAPASKRGRESRESQQQPSTKRQAGSKNRRDDPDGNDCLSDDNFDNSDPEDKKDRSDGDDTEHEYLACPLYRKDPRRYAACAKCRLRRIRDVKQHMRRRHRRPEFYCPTCWETYSGPDERDTHLMDRSCNAPEESGPPWITQEQDTQLEGRVPNRTTVEQWYTVWDIVCPGQTRPNPPFCFLGKMIEDISTLRRELWEESGREIVEELVTQREATLREPLSTENRRLLQRCIIDAVRYVLEHPDVTRAGKVRWNQGDGQSEVASVPHSPGRAHGAPEDDPEGIQQQTFETQDDLIQDGHAFIPTQGLQFGGTQLGELDLMSWWDSQTFQGIDAGDLNFLDAFQPSFCEGHEIAFDFTGGPTSA
ncbi:hypothetical protein Landi51_01119 [Colletotrichum acutatum]